MKCCKKMDEAIEEEKIFVSKEGYEVSGCCSNCSVIWDCLYCPFCGTKFVNQIP